VNLNKTKGGNMNEQTYNCWEFKKCGRELGGRNATELGICPASMASALDGVHSGKNAGRACWVVSGTLCKGETQGTFAKKFENCESCDFYHKVRQEEFPAFKYSSVLLAMVK
jgi:hypothetical protein